MAVFNKFQIFVEDLAKGVHNFNPPANNGNVIKVFLSNTANPPSTTNALKSQIAEIPQGNGYLTGGNTAVITGSVQTTGTYKLTLADAIFTANASGSIGPFQYAILYNSNTAVLTNPLIGWYDYGSAITLLTGESLTVDFDPTNGALTLV
jgi:hypothetical protein